MCVCDKIELNGKWMDGLDWVDVESGWMWKVESGLSGKWRGSGSHTYLKSLLFSSDSCCKQRNMVSLDLCKECLNMTKIRTSVHEFHTFSGNYYLVVCSTLCNWRPAGTWPMDLKYLRRPSLTRIRLVCKLYEFLTLRVFRHLQIYHTIQGRIQGFRAGASS